MDTLHPTGRPVTKEEARQAAYAGLLAAKAARFPFPIHGRIPNFKGAEAAARRLRELPVYKAARTVKVNPDAPQLPVRAMVLADGKKLIIPSPRLRGAFWLILPEQVPKGEQRKAASLTHVQRYGREIDLDELAALATGENPIDLIVAGSVAVDPNGGRAGKGHGYADMEYALLREIGAGAPPVITTVHPAQIVSAIEIDAHDLSVDFIVTPDQVIETHTPYPKPQGLDWRLVDDEDLKAMPVLARLREKRWETLGTSDIVREGLEILFVGINPGRTSARTGHNFAGPGNHFWRLLHESGLTPVQYRPEQERELLRHGLGITNVVARPTRGESDLSWDELVEGAKTLREKVKRLRPRVVALLGKNVYRAYAGLKPSAPVEWGLQPSSGASASQETSSSPSASQPSEGPFRPSDAPSPLEYVAPNPSARSTIPYAERLEHFRRLRGLISP